ncbi:hypothetical protein LSPH26S_01453 [Lysinibacillus sphaericus]
MAKCKVDGGGIYRHVLRTRAEMYLRTKLYDRRLWSHRQNARFLLVKMGANVHIVARSVVQVSEAKAYGYKASNLDD